MTTTFQEVNKDNEWLAELRSAKINKQKKRREEPPPKSKSRIASLNQLRAIRGINHGQ